MDAQSALRRCIELFSHNTRFFIIVEDKYKLLKPILSRFCEIYVPEPIINGVPINLYKYNLNETFKMKDIKSYRQDNLKKELIKLNENREKIKSFVMYVNCSHGKGIKFIREDLKFFAKTHINSNGGNIFKSIILLNADKLTMDAQSALRRCIELFSHNTRFFIIAEDKYNLMKPILSRFCEIYVPEPVINNNIINLYQYNLNEVFKMKDIKTQRLEWLKKELLKSVNKKVNLDELIMFCNKLYEKSYSALDIMNLLENTKFIEGLISTEKKYELLICFNRVRKEFRNEKLLILFVLNFIFLSSELSLENISFM
jgi:DNA polymerase III delta prime subunit